MTKKLAGTDTVTVDRRAWEYINKKHSHVSVVPRIICFSRFSIALSVDFVDVRHVRATRMCTSWHSTERIPPGYESSWLIVHYCDQDTPASMSTCWLLLLVQSLSQTKVNVTLIKIVINISVLISIYCFFFIFIFNILKLKLCIVIK